MQKVQSFPHQEQFFLKKKHRLLLLSQNNKYVFPHSDRSRLPAPSWTRIHTSTARASASGAGPTGATPPCASCSGTRRRCSRAAPSWPRPPTGSSTTRSTRRGTWRCPRRTTTRRGTTGAACWRRRRWGGMKFATQTVVSTYQTFICAENEWGGGGMKETFCRIHLPYYR